MRQLDVVLAHDYLTQRGGAERVTVELARALNPSYLITAIYSPEDAFPEMNGMSIHSTALSKVKLFRKDSRLALPLLASAWNSIKPVRADAVVCSSSGWAHALPTSGATRKIVYCHNPARWLYQTEDYLLDRPWPVRAALSMLQPGLMKWDRKAAASADVYIANSTSVAERIRRVYGREARVVFPPVSVDPTLATEPVSALIGKSFFLMVGRSRGYKGAQPLVEAFRGMPEHVLAVAGGGKIEDVPDNVVPTGYVSEAQLRWLYANARALISVSREDFGLTPIEANAFGTPVLLLRAGGFLDSTDEGTSGLFIEEATPEAIRAAVRAFPETWDTAAIKRHAEKFSPHRFHEAIRGIVVETCNIG
ncbi:glycosyltransferase [Rhizobium sp.]|uniref:glycosyltransferase n=1 Tax=Rhizobium sp. TaxID=391 RepID=UPI000E988A06|nr:glycosyl transferase family 1 [Rhizobium sp.]